ncbi:MAG: hypothetical protein F6K19_16030 [Cyanothece sp. SIO1E1]|nr:hypothetical protein [Cyanothece sp. SIO1E1]
MPQLSPIQLEDGTVLYIEATEDITTPPGSLETSEAESEEPTRTAKGGGRSLVQKQMVQNFQAIQGTIRAYTSYTLNAFKQVAIANIDKVTLEFGIKIGGEAGVPYVTKGTAESNLKITVQCSFPNSD